MEPKSLRRNCLFALLAGAVLSLVGCTADNPSSAAAGPGVENPAAAAPNTIVPAIGTAGNGGGTSGGGAGSAVSH